MLNLSPNCEIYSHKPQIFFLASFSSYMRNIFNLQKKHYEIYQI